jgi:hypothetical protein
MAERRMFSARITESTRFLKMPATSQNLYFHLGLNADDDGVVEAYPVMCKTGATEDDLRVLVGKEFVSVLNDDLVSFIIDWREHNYIRADRKVDSIYKDLLLQVLPDTSLLQAKETYYSRNKKALSDICQTNDGQVTDICQQFVGIGKDRLGKDSIVKDNINTICSELQEKKGTGIKIPLVDGTYFDVPEDKIPLWKQAYPAVNIDQELKKIIAWCDANPTKRKTRRGVTKFINSWLDRSQNQSRGTNGQQTGVRSGENKQGYIDSYI